MITHFVIPAKAGINESVDPRLKHAGMTRGNLNTEIASATIEPRFAMTSNTITHSSFARAARHNSIQYHSSIQTRLAKAPHLSFPPSRPENIR